MTDDSILTTMGINSAIINFGFYPKISNKVWFKLLIFESIYQFLTLLIHFNLICIVNGTK